jgi:histidinol phosphatase-like PHP family hydrolase
MKIDLHVHTSDRSPCGASTAIEMVESAIEHGLDAIFLTDHNRLCPPEELSRLNRIYAPFQIFGGIEINVEDEHVVVLGVNDPILEQEEWSWPNLHRFVHARVGLTILAHPYRFHPGVQIDIEKYPPDFVEIKSLNTAVLGPDQLRTLFKTTGAFPVKNSDAHHRSSVGSFFNTLKKKANSQEEVLHLLEAGRYDREPIEFDTAAETTSPSA